MDWDYNEIKLQGSLSEIINCIWWENYSDVHPQNNKHVLIPDNSIELIFTNSDIKRHLPLTNEYKTRKSQLAGLRISPQTCTVLKSPVISVRFKPKTFYLLCKTDVIKTIDNNLNPVECFGDSVLDLEKELFKTSLQQDRIHLIENYFENYLNDIGKQRDKDFEKIVSYIESKKGDCTIRELPTLFNTSASTIERKFKKKLGLTPKKYSMLVRFVNQFLFGKKDFSDYCYNNGFNYFDQSHFIKEMRKFSGLTPKQLSLLNIGIQEVNFE
ncbi:DUF6597 domain-containing transcriptional factor [Marinifilum sp.]|uniref:DUF6597 domain-containing transcriptional factor n=1 Tax=Marinifilum sp. TaxID=2033137 RepID=UPI003BAD2296